MCDCWVKAYIITVNYTVGCESYTLLTVGSFADILQKNRAQIPCFFESQLTGCLKPFCPFLHTRPRPVDPTAINTPANIPAPTTKGESQAAVTDPNLSPAIQEQMRIPTVLNQPRLRPHQSAAIPTPPIMSSYPAVGTRPMLEMPRLVPRAPQFTGPPRPGGMVQPDSVMGGVPSGLAGVPVRYGRGVYYLVTLQHDHTAVQLDLIDSYYKLISYVHISDYECHYMV